MGLEVNIILAYALGLILLYIVGWLLVVPLKILMKFIWNGIIGGIGLIIFNLVGGLLGFYIPINPFTALIAGFLGIPGILLMIVLSTIL